MSQFVKEAQAQVNDAHSKAYNGYTLQSELLLSGILQTLEISTVHAGWRTDLGTHVVDNIIEIRSNQIDQLELLQAINIELQKTNELLATLIEKTK